MKTILNLLGSIGLAVARIIDWLEAQRLIRLGKLEEKQEQQERKDDNEELAEQIDARPTPDDKLSILGGLRRKEDRH